LTRLLALVGGLAVLAAFYMPWFATQNLLLSGDFLDQLLRTASPAQLRQFIPNSSESEITLLHALVDLFPVCGALAVLASLLGSFVRSAMTTATIVQGLVGVVVLAAWAAGVSRLPPNASMEIGLWLMLAGALLSLVGTALEVVWRANRS
jgi:hypothetical protein